MVRVLTVASVNVNGIRAAFKRGMADWVEARRPDVLLLQEVRASDEILGDHLSAADWHLAHEASETKGRAGVAIACRPPTAPGRGCSPSCPRTCTPARPAPRRWTRSSRSSTS